MKYNIMRSSNVLLVHWMQEIHILQVIQRESVIWPCGCYVLRLKKKEIQKIHIAAHLHDIGKIGVPDAILLKEERLETEEWEQMKKHSEIGAEILSKSHHLGELKDIVLHHHERYDGGGYPAGIQGKQIPLGSRIIAIAIERHMIGIFVIRRLRKILEKCMILR